MIDSETATKMLEECRRLHNDVFVTPGDWDDLISTLQYILCEQCDPQSVNRENNEPR